MPLDDVPHFDMLHPARRLWRPRDGAGGGCRRRRLPADDARAGAVRRRRGSATCPGSRFRRASSVSCAPAIRVRSSRCSSTTGSIWCRWPRSLARAVQLARRRAARRAATAPRRWRSGASTSAPGCTAIARRRLLPTRGDAIALSRRRRAEALYRLGAALPARAALRGSGGHAGVRLLELTEPRACADCAACAPLRQFAAEALAIHHEHRERDLDGARELALFALEEADGGRADGMRHRLARLDRKTRARRQTLSSC